MNALVNLLPAYFGSSSSPTPNEEDLSKRAVDPSSNANGGFANNSSQKTSFPAGTTKPSPTTSASKASSSAASSSLSSASLPSSSSALPTSIPSPSATLPPPPLNVSQSSASATISPSSSPAAENSSGGGLSGGAIGAIVAVVIIVVGGLFAFLFLRRRRQKRIAARAGAGAMRDPYNEGFSSFPPPPAPMAFTSDQYHSPSSPISPAAGSAPYPPQQPPSSYQYNQPYPITAPNMISTPPMSSSNAPATMAAVGATAAGAAAITTTDYSTPPSQPGDIWQQPPLGTFTVLTTYTPTLSDEIDVQPNDQVQIFEEYDDGWCLGINITRGQKRGVFPKHCVTPEDQPAHANPSSQSLAVSDPNAPATSSAGKRVSSLYMENPPQL